MPASQQPPAPVDASHPLAVQLHVLEDGAAEAGLRVVAQDRDHPLGGAVHLQSVLVSTS